ncbi:YfiT family bacillithiol transferase [Granulicella arctica]|uniref:YfiT family bacillithiol transferase n=1 Tax=Granulicella arctica TaxID=940613 RepID=UPI0021E0E70F|nr:putative metal-dependent hydrolase [Granulicella arctica]
MSPDAQYPIGRFETPESISAGEVRNAITMLADTPSLLRNAVGGLKPPRLTVPYRPGGWTIQQVVHHLADSHMNAFVRFRLALTEDWPTIKVYDEAAWAELHDSLAPIEWSLELIESLHARWIMLLFSLKDAQWKCGYVHPERGRVALDVAVLHYAWHSQHHLAHITHLRAREGW